MLGPLSGQVNITEQLHVMTTKHIHNSIVHCNPIVRLVANRALHCARSPMGANVAYLRCKYGVDFTNALNANINGINVFHQLDEHNDDTIICFRPPRIVYTLLTDYIFYIILLSPCLHRRSTTTSPRGLADAVSVL